MAFITPPLNLPYSASKELVIRRNSATESRFGTRPAPMFRLSLTSPPFTRKPFAFSRCPLTDTLPRWIQAGQRQKQDPHRTIRALMQTCRDSSVSAPSRKFHKRNRVKFSDSAGFIAWYNLVVSKEDSVKIELSRRAMLAGSVALTGAARLAGAPAPPAARPKYFHM